MRIWLKRDANDGSILPRLRANFSAPHAPDPTKRLEVFLRQLHEEPLAPAVSDLIPSHIAPGTTRLTTKPLFQRRSISTKDLGPTRQLHEPLALRREEP
jgi:hypothetical protein